MKVSGITVGQRERLVKPGYYQLVFKAANAGTAIAVALQGNSGANHVEFLLYSPYLGSDGGGFPMLVSGGSGAVGISGADPEAVVGHSIMVEVPDSATLYSNAVPQFVGYLGESPFLNEVVHL